jgi:enoyl-CoA hydratase
LLTFQTLELEEMGPIATLRLNRPDLHNALDELALAEILKAVTTLASREDIRALIVTSAVPKTFCVGAHLPSLASLDTRAALDFARAGHRVAESLEAAPFATIAAVNGVALGGGWELALACDLIYASTTAIFGFPEVDLGLFPAFGGANRLIDLVGPMRARELVFTASRISAQAAKELRLVLDVRPLAELYPACLAVAERIASKGQRGIAHVKRSISLHLRGDADALREFDADVFSQSDLRGLDKRRT